MPIDLTQKSENVPSQAPVGRLTTRDNFTDHFHNGIDSSRVSWANIFMKKLSYQFTLSGASAATAANYGVFFIAPAACYVSDFREVHQTAGTDGGAVTLDLEKLTNGTAPDAGVSVLSSALSLKTTANIVQTATLTNTLANRNLLKNERLCLKDSGTLTNVANVAVLLELTFV